MFPDLNEGPFNSGDSSRPFTPEYWDSVFLHYGCPQILIVYEYDL